MTNRTLTTLALCGALAGCGGSDATRTETADEAASTEPAPTASHEARVLPSAVMVMSVDLECPEHQVYFETGSAELTPRAEDSLDAYAACLRAEPGDEEIAVTGMTDPRGNEPYNQELAQDRAQSVATYLASQGVDDGFHISAVGEQGAVEDMPELWPVQRRVRLDTMDEGS